MKKINKMLLLSLMAIVCLGGFNITYAVQSKAVVCAYKDKSKCVAAGIPVDQSYDASGSNSFTEIGSLPSLPTGYIDQTYYYIPDSNNPNNGIGVINGHMYQNPSNPLGPFNCYKDSNSSVYTNYFDWKNALINLGITPPVL